MGGGGGGAGDGSPSSSPRAPRCENPSLLCREMRCQEIREACGHFRRPRKKKLQHSESCAATKQTQALYWLRLPASVQMWFETTRFVYFVKLKHASRTFFNLKLQRTAFHSKNAPKKCSQSSPRAPKTSPKCLRELPGDVLRGHTHLQSGPGASPTRQSGQSVVNSSKVEHPPGYPWGRF